MKHHVLHPRLTKIWQQVSKPRRKRKLLPSDTQLYQLPQFMSSFVVCYELPMRRQPTRGAAGEDNRRKEPLWRACAAVEGQGEVAWMALVSWLVLDAC